MNTEMLIGSRFVKGTGPEEPVINPRTGKVIVSVPEGVARSGERGGPRPHQKPSPNWSRTTPAERSGYLMKLRRRYAAAEQEIADLEALNCGKPRHTVTPDETPAIIDVIRFFAGRLPRHARARGG